MNSDRAHTLSSIGKTLMLLLSLTVATAAAQTEVVATGLQAPQRLVLTAAGNFLVAEPGRIAYVTGSGTIRSLVEGLPFAIDDFGDQSGATGLALHERTLYVAIGGGDAGVNGPNGEAMHNPKGVSSPLFASILRFKFGGNVDQLTGTFRLTEAHRRALAIGDEVDLNDGAGGRLTADVLTFFPIAQPDGRLYRFSNPWGLAASSDGSTLWMSDASQESVYRIDATSGRWQRVVRFDSLQNPTTLGPRRIDTVPTSVRVYNDQLLVTFLTGYPFLQGAARVALVDPKSRTEGTLIAGLSVITDVVWRERQGKGPQFFVIEFSTDMANPAAPGRLLRIDDTPAPTVMAADLRSPVGLAYSAAAQELYVLELGGRILKISLR